MATPVTTRAFDHPKAFWLALREFALTKVVRPDSTPVFTEATIITPERMLALDDPDQIVCDEHQAEQLCHGVASHFGGTFSAILIPGKRQLALRLAEPTHMAFDMAHLALVLPNYLPLYGLPGSFSTYQSAQSILFPWPPVGGANRTFFLRQLSTLLRGEGSTYPIPDERLFEYASPDWDIDAMPGHVTARYAPQGVERTLADYGEMIVQWSRTQPLFPSPVAGEAVEGHERYNLISPRGGFTPEQDAALFSCAMRTIPKSFHYESQDATIAITWGDPHKPEEQA